MDPEIRLSARAGKLLRANRKTLSVAESCTGGMLGSILTSIPGSSDYFLGGVIAYQNQVKEKFLGLSPERLKKFGAVSRETAGELARGARKKFHAHIGIGITGIAGPSGGTKTKPVGLVFVAVESSEKKRDRELRLRGNRQAIRRSACLKALESIIEFLEEA